MADSASPDAPSIVSGIPLREEQGIGPLTIGGYARAVTTRFADREALAFHGGSAVVRLSYAEVWQRSVEVARALIAAGVDKDTRVGVLMTNRPEYIVLVFGIALAGGVSVLLNTFSTPRELKALLETSNLSLLFFERQVAKKDFAAMLLELEPKLQQAQPGRLVSTAFPFLRRVVMMEALDAATQARPPAIESYRQFLEQGEAVALEQVDARAATARPADTAVLFFSSGTTAGPKGMLHAHRAIALQWWRWPSLLKLHDDVRCWTANAFFWSGNFSLQFGSSFTTGGTAVLLPTFDAERALELIEAERVTFPVFSQNQQLAMAAASNFERVDLSSLRYLNDVSPLRPHPTVSTNWVQPATYGTTETLTACTVFPATTRDAAREGYGLPLPGNTVKIIDPETGAAVARGQRGEIVVKGPTLMLGYLGKTADETFDAEGFFHTGDGGYVDDSGWLFFEGRRSLMVKRKGALVSPLEVDSVIRGYPGVKVTQTLGHPQSALDQAVVSCIVTHDGHPLDETSLRKHMKQHLASFKMPDHILFLQEDEVEMTGSDKVRLDKLYALVSERLA